MSALRVCVVVALSACLAVLVRGRVIGVGGGGGASQDPTNFCYPAQGSPQGGWVSDAGYWDLIGLQSTYSSSYNVLCAFSGLYLNGPAGTNTEQFAPWHGNPNDTNCGAILVSQYAQSTERGNPAAGIFAVRQNAATGDVVVTSFHIVGTCNNATSNQICAGNCVGSPSYDADEAVLQQDPTYTTYTTSGAAGPNVVTTLNSTQPIGNVTSSGSPKRTTVISAVTSLIKCVGPETLVCSVQNAM